MPLAKGTVNPLNILGQRKLSYSPPHFASVNLNDIALIEKFDHWIYSNLNNRYCVRTKLILDQNRKIKGVCEVSFEDPKELSMFILACPYLHKT